MIFFKNNVSLWNYENKFSTFVYIILFKCYFSLKIIRITCLFLIQTLSITDIIKQTKYYHPPQKIYLTLPSTDNEI